MLRRRAGRRKTRQSSDKTDRYFKVIEALENRAISEFSGLVQSIANS